MRIFLSLIAFILLTVNAYALDPCSTNKKSIALLNQNTATTTRIITPVAGQKTYICSAVMMVASADNVVFLEGTGGTCGSGTASMAGDTTIGFAFAGNGGMTLGNGLGTVMQTATVSTDVCVKTSTVAQLSGAITYTQQ